MSVRPFVCLSVRHTRESCLNGSKSKYTSLRDVSNLRGKGLRGCPGRSASGSLGNNCVILMCGGKRTCQDRRAVRPDGVEHQTVSWADSGTQQSTGRRKRLANDQRAGAGRLVDVERRRHLERHPLAVSDTHRAPVAAWTSRIPQHSRHRLQTSP